MKNKRTILAALLLSTMLANPAFANSKTLELVAPSNLQNDMVIKTVSDYMLKDNNEAFIVTSKSPSDALVGGVLAGESKGSLIFDDYAVKTDLTKKKVSYIGGKLSVDIAEINATHSDISRLAGDNRYETAVEIAKKLGTGRSIIICSGEKFVDSYSAISYASLVDSNILLVGKDEIPAATKAYLKSFGKAKTIQFIGGESTISKKVKDEVLSLVGSHASSNDLTIAGHSRFETSKEVTKKFTDSKELVITDGNDERLSLLAATLSAKNSCPLLLMRDQAFNLDELKNSKIEKIYIVGQLSNNQIDSINALKQAGISLKDFEGKDITLEKPAPEVKLETIQKEEVKKVEEKPANIVTLANGDKIDKDNKQIILKDGRVKKYSRVIEMNTTAYNIFPGSTGYTASGTKARPGAVAVDPRVIPLGTELYIQSTDEWEDYGFAVAEDTGGAIKGNKLDVFYYDYNTVMNFGRRTTIVYVFE